MHIVRDGSVRTTVKIPVAYVVGTHGDWTHSTAMMVEHFTHALRCVPCQSECMWVKSSCTCMQLCTFPELSDVAHAFAPGLRSSKGPRVQLGHRPMHRGGSGGDWGFCGHWCAVGLQGPGPCKGMAGSGGSLVVGSIDAALVGALYSAVVRAQHMHTSVAGAPAGSLSRQCKPCRGGLRV